MEGEGEKRRKPLGEPSNAVYKRVGDDVKVAVHQGVHRGLTPKDIIREIAQEHGVHLNVGELRLLLAARRNAPEQEPQPQPAEVSD